MKWGKRMMLGMLVMSVFFSTVILGKNLWMQEKEELKFVSLRKSISEIRDDHPSRPGPKAEQADEMTGCEKEREILPEYQELAAENPDFSGWISIEGTNIDYPVMQTSWELEYYLHRNFAGDYSYAGVPFVGTGDIKADNGDIFIYGHNMRNGSMFADLLKYQKEAFWREHPVIALDTLWEHRKYEIFAAFYANEEEWIQESGRLYQVLYRNGLSKTESVCTLKETGEYDTWITPEPECSILFLVTCSYREPGSRFVVAGALKNKYSD